MRLINEIHCLGYQRIGLAIWEQQDKHQRHTHRSVLSAYQMQIPDARRVPPLIEAELSKEAFLQWVSECQPDVVVGGVDQIYHWLLEGGWSVPEDIAFARPQLMGFNPNFSGIRYDHTAFGVAGIDTIAGQINRNERGSPEQARRILIPGKWHAGSTTRAMGGRRAKPVFHLV